MAVITSSERAEIYLDKQGVDQQELPTSDMILQKWESENKMWQGTGKEWARAYWDLHGTAMREIKRQRYEDKRFLGKIGAWCKHFLYEGPAYDKQVAHDAAASLSIDYEDWPTVTADGRLATDRWPRDIDPPRKNGRCPGLNEKQSSFSSKKRLALATSALTVAIAAWDVAGFRFAEDFGDQVGNGLEDWMSADTVVVQEVDTPQQDLVLGNE